MAKRTVKARTFEVIDQKGNARTITQYDEQTDTAGLSSSQREWMTTMSFLQDEHGGAVNRLSDTEYQFVQTGLTAKLQQ